MTHVSAAIFALAAAGAMLGVAAARHETPGGAQVVVRPSSGQEGLDKLAHSTKGDMEARSLEVVSHKANFETPPPIAAAKAADEPLVWPPLDSHEPPKLVEAHVKPAVDPVCGKKGRTWYTKHGWKYWRCVR